MKQYVDLVNRILDEGEYRSDRTGVGTFAVFGGRMEFDLRERFPLVTIKETRWKTAFLEMLWFLRGEGDTNWLNTNGCRLWDAWAKEDGDLGPIYGVQWRAWAAIENEGAPRFVDQIGDLIEGIKSNPIGRRHIVSAWNVGDLPEMALPPCHMMFQCYASSDGQWLDMQVYQRSWDVALGAPFNIAQYALLLHLLARATGRKPRNMAFVYGDAHLYANHITTMRDLMKSYKQYDCTPQLHFKTDNTDIDGYKPDDFYVVGYEHGPFIKLEVAV